MKQNGNANITGDYYIGLDVGTSSVGWAVTNPDYTIPRFKGQAMWGVRLFEEAQTAAERRTNRTARRRLERQKLRRELLQLLMNEEVLKKDPYFFKRMEESALFADDRTEGVGTFSLFNDKDFTDKEFHKRYPTMYHLRAELIRNKEPHDVRLVYLALHHIMKSRGHFLYEGDGGSDEKSLSGALEELDELIREMYEGSFEPEDSEAFVNALQNSKMTITDKKRALRAAYGTFGECDGLDPAVLSDALAGTKIGLEKLFLDDELKNAEISKLCLKDDMDSIYDELSGILGERMDIVQLASEIFDLARLRQLLGDSSFISEAKVAQYEKNYRDLRLLKKYVREFAPEKYHTIFSLKKEKVDNYAAYSGYKTKSGDYECTQESFCKWLCKQIPSPKELAEKQGIVVGPEYEAMFAAITEHCFLPRLRSTENGVIPYQLHRKELNKILENASSYLPFLTVVDEDGLTIKEKILTIFDYRIPYYVGPLNTASPNHWVVRTDEKIYPWNFDKVVDQEKSAEKFIINLTGKCTYTGADALPKNSLLYSEYMVLNEINPIRLNDQPIPVEVKQRMYFELFVESSKKVTKKGIFAWLKHNGLATDTDKLTGIDDNIKSQLKSHHDFRNILKETGDEKMVEDLIFHILVFSDDRSMLKKWVRKTYPQLSEKDVSYVCKLKYDGWGSLSEEYLTQLVNTEKDGTSWSIMDYLRNTNLTMMQLRTDAYSFAEMAEKVRKERFGENVSLKKRLQDMYVSPAVRRSLMQTARIVDEIVDIKKAAPKKLFIEVTRTDDASAKGKRTVSRKEQLLALYKSAGQQESELYRQLENEEDNRLRRDKLYLYYTQMGKCMYSGESIDLETAMAGDSVYDIDHIFPRSRIKDDSIDNRVLVRADLNRSKSNSYPISEEIRKNMYGIWKALLDKKLISEKKFNRLYRHEPLTEEELSSFVQRQLVETGQSVKALATLMKEYYPQTKVVYSKASNVSEFRQKRELFKCRDVNDLHHAKDAYLNIVVGNVYNTKFTEKFFLNIKSQDYSLNKIFDYPVSGAWDPDGSMQIVRKNMSKSNAVVTWMPREYTGALYDLQLMQAGKGQLEKKTGMDIDRYGGYNKLAGAYFCVVEHEEKKKRVRTIEPVLLYRKKLYESDPIRYCEEVRGLVEPKIIASKVMFDSVLELDGVRYCITGRTGSRFLYKHTYQLAVEAEIEKDIKNILKYCERCAAAKTELSYSECYDGISTSGNEKLFAWLENKLGKRPYSEIAACKNIKAIMEEKEQKFKALGMRQQCDLLAQVLKIFKCDSQSVDLTQLGGAARAGIITFSSKLNAFTSAYLTQQSVTGLYETKIDLLN